MSEQAQEFLATYIPRECGEHEVEVAGEKKKVSATHKGSIVLEVPDYIERMEYLDEAGFKVMDGKVEYNPTDTSGVRKMVMIARKKVKKVDIEVLESKAHHKSWASLERDPGCSQMVAEVAFKLLEGFKPSPNS